MKRVIIYIVFALMLSGCNKESGSLSVPEAGASPSVTTAKLMEGGTLNICSVRPDTFNPLIAKYESVRDFLDLIYEPLFSYDSEMRPIPVLAQSYIIQDGGKKFIITLKKGIRWHDESEFTAKDVEYTFKAIMKEENQSIYKEQLSDVRQIKVLDHYTLEFSLQSPLAGWIGELYFPIIQAQKSIDLLPLKSAFLPIGTGKYRYEEHEFLKKVTLVRNESWWQEIKPHIANVVVQVLPDENVVFNAFGANSVDVARVSQSQVGKFMAKSNASSLLMPSNVYSYLGIQLNNEILKSIYVRRAIYIALSKKKLEETIFSDGAVGAKTPIHPFSPYYIGAELQEDVKALLLAEGYVPGSNGNFMKDGKKLSFSLIVNEDNITKCTAADCISQILKEYGIEIIVKRLTWEKYMEAITSGKYDLYFGETKIKMNYDLGFLLREGGSQNYGGYISARMNDAIDSALRSENEDMMKSSLTTIQQIFIEDLPHIPLYFRHTRIVYDASRVAAESVVDCGNMYASIADWYIKIRKGK